jgi:hypothetical protein
MMRFSADFFINSSLSLLGIFLLVVVSEYPKEARMFPQLVLIIVITLSVLDMVNKIRTGRKNPPAMTQNSQTVDAHPKQTTRFFLTIGLMIAFLYTILLFGFVLGNLIFIYFSAWALGYKNIKYLTLFSLIITGFIYAVFILIMDSYFSPGIIFELLRGS